MKAITLTQPYATLIALGQKKIETRSWQTSYRGPLAIHAGKGLGPVGGKMGLFRLCSAEPFASVLRAWHAFAPSYPEVWLPRGAIVATCDLVDCVPTTYVRSVKIVRRGVYEWLWTENEKAFGDYADGRWAWLLSNIRALPEPIPAKGALSLWEWEGER
jgi:activating signal cointegrator 1